MVIQYLQVVRLPQQKTNLIVTTIKIMERFCKDLQEHAMK